MEFDKCIMVYKVRLVWVIWNPMQIALQLWDAEVANSLSPFSKHKLELATLKRAAESMFLSFRNANLIRLPELIVAILALLNATEQRDASKALVCVLVSCFGLSIAYRTPVLLFIWESDMQVLMSVQIQNAQPCFVQQQTSV